MKLELATVVSCHAAGCAVRPLGSQATLEAAYATPVYNQIRIRRGDLVALDLAPDPPQIVWRWRRAEVLHPLTRQPVEGHVFAGSACHAFEARLARPDLHPLPGDTVWFMGHEHGMEIADRAIDGVPERPDWIRQTYFPIVEAYYASLDTSP